MAQINKPSDYFNTVLYTGNNTTNAITTGFQPDLVWLKPRNLADHHRLMNSVSGADYYLSSNQTLVESATGTNFASFDSDGFTLGGSDNGWNNSSYNYASWNWLAGGTASSNTDGSITSNVSASTTSGFSIVSWTGTGSNLTVGHGLGVAPDVIINKNRSSGSTQWQIYFKKISSTPETSYIYFNTGAAVTNYGVFWNSTNPTSSVFSIGTNDDLNTSGENVISYCFAEKKGFSKFGSYTGNGSTDGTFVYTGFKPAFLMVKPTSTTGAWYIYDNKRAGYNVKNYQLYPHANNAEGTTDQVDLLSNGFKWRAITGDPNSSGRTYIYMAFAENPLVGTNNIPATAR